jgi:nucleoside-diphosphate-sugar epimerase
LTLRALITGGAGFIGVHLARRLLAERARVDLVDDFSRGRRDPDLAALSQDAAVRCIERDVLVPGSLDDLPADYHLVFHLAAIVGVANVTRQPLEVLRRNLEMLLAVQSLAARQRRLQRLVFASTSEVHAGSASHLGLLVPTPEDAPVVLPDLAQSRATYLLSKLYGEALCYHAGLPFTIIRPYNIYGPRMGMAHVIPELLQRAERTREGGTMTVYSMSHRRAFCYVSDAVELIVRLALAEDAVGAAFNVGNQAEELAVGQLAALVMSTVGRQLTLEPGPDTPGSPARRCPDMSRTSTVTGYLAGVSLPVGLRKTYDWYRDHVFRPAGVAVQ